jgi:phosphohistidine swiveling domain-containing protein
MAENAAITGPDGQTIPIEWVYDDAPKYEWILEREHWPEPFSPMELWIWKNGAAGGDRAWAELGLEPPIPFRRFQTLGPYLYFNASEPPPDELARLAAPFVALSQKHGGALGLWTTFCEPRIKQACDDLTAMQADADLSVAAELLFYGFHQTFTCLGLMFIPGIRLSAMLTQHNIDDAELTGFELLQGGENATQQIDEEIWKLAELTRATPAVASIIDASGDGALDALHGEPLAAHFVKEFDALIARHGHRSQGWMLMLETWGERPQAALSLVRAQLRSDRTSPDELRRKTAQKRQQAIDRVLRGLPEEKHDEFWSILDELDGYVPVRENRAYWQLVITGAMRGLLLRKGDDLVRKGFIDHADDVLFLTPDDVARHNGDLRERVANARAEWDRWRAFEPPAVIGTPGKSVAEAQAKRAEFKGSPASRGTATGRVRILSTPEEGGRLERGDILVCVMTTPAWTPLFAIAGGIVTETGGPLSHPAITAREYGIPAVVALSDATTRLRDGQVLTIDGGAGTVTTVR